MTCKKQEAQYGKDIWKLPGMEFLRIFFFVFVNHVNIGPYGSQHFKMLLLPQTTFESFQTFSEFSSRWSSQTYCFGFLQFWVFNFSKFFFALTWDPMGAETSKRYSSSNHFWFFSIFLALLDHANRAHEIEICPSAVRRLSVSQLSQNLLSRFLSNFSCGFPWGCTRVEKSHFLSFVCEFVNFSLTLDPMGANFKTILLPLIAFESFQTFLALLDYVSRGHEIEIRPSSVVRPSVRLWHRISLKLLDGFLSDFSCGFPWAICPDFFWFFTNIFRFR